MKQIVSVIALLCLWASQAAAKMDYWRHEWPKTDFTKQLIPPDGHSIGRPAQGRHSAN